MSVGGYDFGQIIENVAKLSPQAGDIIVISGKIADEESVNRISREIARRNAEVSVMLVPEGYDVYLLHPTPGDFLLVRGDVDEEALGHFVAIVREHHPDLVVQTLPDNVFLEIADEAMMRTLGWVRATGGT